MLERIALATARALRNERLSPKELQRLVDKKIRATVAFAYRSVPYYHELLRANHVHPDEIRTATDLRRIPLTTKDDVRRHGDRMLAVGVDRDRLSWRKTSGTRGKPVLLAKDTRANVANMAVSARWEMAVSARPWNKTAHVVHSKSDPVLVQRPGDWGLLGRVRGKFRRLVFLDNIRHTTEVIDELSLFKPMQLVSHAYNLRLIALHMNEESPTVEPKAIHTGAGEVADPKTTTFLEKSFGCPAYGIYGSRETGPLGFECRRRRGYHINVDHRYGEYLSDDRPAGEGELAETVWTTLENRAMPLIRYRLGDLVVATDEECPCGRSLPLIRSVDGRIEDLVVLADGRLVTPASILSRLHVVQGVARFRLLQRTLERFDIEFTRSPRHSERTGEEVLAACRILFGGEAEIRLRERDMSALPVKWSAVASDVSDKALV